MLEGRSFDMRTNRHNRLTRCDRSTRNASAQILERLAGRMRELRSCIDKVGGELDRCRRNEKRRRLITTAYIELVNEFTETAEAYVRCGSRKLLAG